MRTYQGLGKKVLLIACAMAIAVAFVLPASEVSAFEEMIPGKVGLIKPGKLWKLVSKGTDFPLANCETGNPADVGGNLRVTLDGNSLECVLPAGGSWKGLGKCVDGVNKGYKFVNTAAPGGAGGPCKIVIVKQKVIKVLAKSSGDLVAPATGATELVLDVGTDARYCGKWTSYSPNKDTVAIAKNQPAPAECAGGPCVCDAFDGGLLSFLTGIPSGGPLGTVSNFRCSNDSGGACVDAGDCDFGTCFVGTSDTCSGKLTLPCASDADCLGTCAEVVGGNLPADLEPGSLYTGGGLNSVPLPLPVPDRGQSYSRVSLSGGTLNLSRTTPGEVGDRNCTQGRSGSTTNCTFGPPLPIPNPSQAPTSVCVVNDVETDISGTVECDGGDSDINLQLRSNVFLSGDLFTDIAGVQPCPLCLGGDPGTCRGGPNDGGACTPETSDSAALGDLQNSYPTSLDCPPDPLLDITSAIRGLPVDLTLTTGAQIVDAVDQPKGERVFCGYCRDVLGDGSLCFEGDNVKSACPNFPGSGEATPCNSDADCAEPYESCAQRNPGAFNTLESGVVGAAATRIEVSGTTSGCLGNGPITQNQVSIFCVPPTFDETVDAAGDLPGPGVTLLFGEAQLE